MAVARSAPPPPQGPTGAASALPLPQLPPSGGRRSKEAPALAPTGAASVLPRRCHHKGSKKEGGGIGGRSDGRSACGGARGRQQYLLTATSSSPPPPVATSATAGTAGSVDPEKGQGEGREKKRGGGHQHRLRHRRRNAGGGRDQRRHRRRAAPEAGGTLGTRQPGDRLTRGMVQDNTCSFFKNKLVFIRITAPSPETEFSLLCIIFLKYTWGFLYKLQCNKTILGLVRLLEIY